MTILEKIQQLPEDDLREQVVIPLMRALGCRSVRCEHGATEHGKDVVYSSTSVYRRPYLGAIVLKARPVRPGAGLMEVQAQVQAAWEVEYPSPADMTTLVKIQEVTIMTSHDFTHAARLDIQAAMGRFMPRVHLFDGEDLATQVMDVIKRAKRAGIVSESYTFDPVGFNEICERLVSSSRGASEDSAVANRTEA